ncbi:hypothetical protein X777_04559, partial [Ooceraea biroi]
FVQLLIVTYRQLQMSGNNSGFLVIACSISRQLQYFGSQIFHHSSQIHGSASTNALSVISFSQKSMDTSDRKLQSCTARSRLCLSLGFTSLSTTRHLCAYE